MIQLALKLVEHLLHCVNKHSPGCHTGCSTGWTTRWMFVYTIQPVAQPVVKPVEQPAACKRLNVELHESNMLNSYNRLNTRLDIRFNVCIHNTTGCPNGCIVYTNIQPIVQPVWQLVVLCKRGLSATTVTFSFRPHCSTSYRQSSMVHMSVSRSLTIVSCAKTAETWT